MRSFVCEISNVARVPLPDLGGQVPQAPPLLGALERVRNAPKWAETLTGALELFGSFCLQVLPFPERVSGRNVDREPVRAPVANSLPHGSKLLFKW